MAPQSLVTAFNVRSLTFIMSLVPTAVAELTILVGIPSSPLRLSTSALNRGLIDASRKMRLAFSATRVRDGDGAMPSSIFSVEHTRRSSRKS